jgi:hypothetical protein
LLTLSRIHLSFDLDYKLEIWNVRMGNHINTTIYPLCPKKIPQIYLNLDISTSFYTEYSMQGRKVEDDDLLEQIVPGLGGSPWSWDFRYA